MLQEIEEEEGKKIGGDNMWSVDDECKWGECRRSSYVKVKD